MKHRSNASAGPVTLVVALALTMAGPRLASASQAYGSINNFDCVNDTGVEAHGFEIEIDDVRSTSVTYTYDYNHYGTPKISEDLTDPAHPKVFVRYASVKKPDGTWAAYTAIPSGPINPTMGHQFTNPAINFGGEHFGVGYYGNPAAVKYNWLIDDGAGNLIHGPAVYISTPAFTYVPPAPAVPAQVVAVVVPPPPPAPPVFQFGQAQWVKAIKTTSHNPHKIKLEELVGDDPGKPQPWANGEAPEVEIEWKLLQTDFNAGPGGGKNGELAGAPEGLPGGDEIVTRRYEFYKYTGPIDAETGEAMADQVAADGKHGVGTVTYADHFDPALGEWVTVTTDLSTVVVVGEFFGAQMAGFDKAADLGLIAHIQDGDLNVPYPDRTVAVEGPNPFIAIVKTGSLPTGLTLDKVTGVLSGTPTVPGVYNFTVEASDTGGAVVTQAYTVKIGGVLPPPVLSPVTTSSSPSAGGTTRGGGTYLDGTTLVVRATPNPGYYFLDWSDANGLLSNSYAYKFTVAGASDLVAHFALYNQISTSAQPAGAGTTKGDGAYRTGQSLAVRAIPSLGNYFVDWQEAGTTVSTASAYSFTAASNRSLTARFAPYNAVTTSVSPVGSGVTMGDGNYKLGQSMTVRAMANPGYYFVNWTESGTQVSASYAYNFSVPGPRTLVANFALWRSISVAAGDGTMGTVAGGGVYKNGVSVTLRATPKSGFHFVGWNEGGTQVSTASRYTFTVAGDRSLTAVFAPN